MSKLPNDVTIEAWVLLHRAQRTLLDHVSSALKSQRLPSLDWYDILLELHRAEDSGLRQFELGERVLLNKHNLSRLVDRLEKQHLLRRDVCEEDGRGNRISITEAGKNMLRSMWPVYGEAMQGAFGRKLNQKECSELARLLGKVLD